MSKYVLDASALLAMLQDEPGAEVVLSRLGQSAMSTVNLAEVIGKLIDAGTPADVVTLELEDLPFERLPFREIEAFATGFMRESTRDRGLSLGDRACLATAAQTGSTVLTTDANWRHARTIVKVEVLR